jgi:hypothetical protein
MTHSGQDREGAQCCLPLTQLGLVNIRYQSTRNGCQVGQQRTTFDELGGSAELAAMNLGAAVGGAEDREMTLLWARLKSWWERRAARAAYRRLFEKDMRSRRRAF